MHDGGGGGGNISAINIEGMSSMISGVRSGASTLQSTATSLQSEASACDVSSPAFAKLIQIGSWAEDQVSPLRRRLSMAQAMQHQGGVKLAVVGVPEPLMSTKTAQARGRSLAAKIIKLQTDDSGAKTLHEVSKELGHDPVLLSAFYGALGPQGTQALPGLMKASGSQTSDEDLRRYSSAFAQATHDPNPPPGFKNVVKIFQSDGATEPVKWARLAMMQAPGFPHDFLARVVRHNGLETLSTDGKINDRVQSDAQGTGLPTTVSALLFRALRNDPVAAREAFNGYNLTNITRAVYADDHDPLTQDAFASAVNQATGGDNKPFHHSSDARDFTRRFMIASGNVEHVPDRVKATLGHIAASWAPELLLASNIEDNKHVTPAGFPKDFQGLGIGPKEVYRYLHGFGDNDQLSSEFDTEMSRIYESTTGKAAKLLKANPEKYSDRWNYTMSLFGGLAGLEYAAQKDVRKDLDEADRDRKGLLSTIFTTGLGFVPGAKVVGSLAWKSLTIGIGQLAKSQVKPGTRADALDKADAAAGLLTRYQIAAKLVAAHYPGSDKLTVLKDKDGHLRPPQDFADPKLAQKFADQLKALDNLNHPRDFSSAANDGTQFLVGSHKDAQDSSLIKDYEKGW